MEVGYMNEQQFLTIDELSEKLKVQKSWLYSRTRETGPGAIPLIRVGKYIRFNLEEVVRWLGRQKENQ